MVTASEKIKQMVLNPFAATYSALGFLSEAAVEQGLGRLVRRAQLVTERFNANGEVFVAEFLAPEVVGKMLLLGPNAIDRLSKRSMEVN